MTIHALQNPSFFRYLSAIDSDLASRVAAGFHHLFVICSLKCAKKERNFLAIFGFEYHMERNAAPFLITEFRD